MSGNAIHWTTQELELYNDGELDPERRTELCDALRRDPKLRERFATVCRVDDCLRDAFLVEAVASHNGSRTADRLSRYALAAACLLMAGGLTWWFGTNRGSSREMSLAQRPVHSNTVDKPAYHSIRVVLSFPVEKTTDRPVDDHTVQTTAVTAASEDARDFLVRLDGTLMTGRIEDTLDLLDVASKRQRTVAYLRLGAVLRSAHAVEQILERLNPQEQLTVCGLWARKPVAQSTVFRRLRRLSTQVDLSDDVHAVVAVLAEDPHLRTWLLGYQLVDSGTFRPMGSG